MPLDVDEKVENTVPIDDILAYDYTCRSLEMEFDKFKHIENNIKKEILDCSSDDGALALNSEASTGSDDEQAEVADSELNSLLTDDSKLAGIG